MYELMDFQFFVVYQVVVNALTFLLFFWDKRAARLKRRRISERNLLLAALMGGSLGGLLAMYLLRHKTQQVKFTWGLPVILLLQVGLLLFFLFSSIQV